MEQLEDRRVLSCTLENSTAVSIPSSTDGVTEAYRDFNCFRFTATSGSVYRFETTPGSLNDSSTSIFDSNGSTSLFADPSGWLAPRDGTFYVRVTGLGEEVGTFTLQASEVIYVDDVANHPDAAQPISIDAPSIEGNIDVAGDVDYFKFTPNTGTRYNISTSNITLANVQLGLRSSQGIAEPLDEVDHIPTFSSLASWTAPSDGEFTLEVKAGSPDSDGTYGLTIETVVDDHGNDFLDATAIAIPSSTALEINSHGDNDVFSFQATGGEIYKFSGSSSFTQNVYATDGTTLLKKINTTFDDEWLAPTSGTFYVSVFARDEDELGAFTFDVSRITHPDDHGSIVALATPVAVPSMTSGRLEFREDVDFFAFNAIADTEYSFYSSFGTDLRLFHDDQVTAITETGRQFITWTAPEDGTYFIEATSSSSETSYTLHIEVPTDDHGDSVSDATSITVPSTTNGRIDFLTDNDFFEFEATEGVNYNFSAEVELNLFDVDRTTELKSDFEFHWIAPSSEIYYLQIRDGNDDSIRSYTLEATTIDYVDDHGSTPTLATMLAAPASIIGEIETDTDVDLFVFDAVAGARYNAFVNAGSLVSRRLRLLDTDGLTQIDIANENETTAAAQISWIAPADGAYYLEVIENRFGDVGTYALDFEIVSDDHGDTIDTASTIAIPFSTSARIDFPDDADFFEFSATTSDVFSFSATSNVLEEDRFSFAVLDSSGNAQLSSLVINDSWIAPSPGTYYLKVSTPVDDNVGNYFLTVSSPIYSDDYGSTLSQASPLLLPSSTIGAIEVTGDRDLFAFEATAGEVYLFSPTASDVIQYIEVIDSGGYRLSGSPFFEPETRWVAPSSGTFFLRVSARGNSDTGGYAFDSSVVTYADDHGNTPPDATPLSAPTIIQGQIEVLNDVDFFSLDANVGDIFSIYVSAEPASELRPFLLIGIDGTTRIESVLNDDHETWVAPSTGTYVLTLFHPRHLETGNYEISVAKRTLSPPCDYTGNGNGCNITDLDYLYHGYPLAPVPLSDELISGWLSDASNPLNPAKENASDVYVHGDADLDGDVDSVDLGLLLNNFLDASGLGWGGGNFNSDFVVDSVDLGLQLNNFGFTSFATSALSVGVLEPHPIFDASSVDTIERWEEEKQDDAAFEFAFAPEFSDDGEDEDAELIDQVFAAM